MPRHLFVPLRSKRFRLLRRRGPGGDRGAWWQVTATVVAVLALVVFAVALLCRQFAFDWQPLIVTASFSHQLMWASCLALLAGVARRWALTAVAAICCGVMLLIELPPVLRDAPDAHGRPLVVLQANLKVGSADPAALVSRVRVNSVDLLATEELTQAEQRRLIAAGLAQVLRYRYTAPLPDGGGGLGVWSRYPLAAGQNLPGYQLGVLILRVALPAGPTNFVAVHLLPPWPYASSTWTREISRLGTVLRGLTGPVVVAGDFNATVDHARFRRLLAGGYADATSRAGSGYQATYPTDRWFPPVLAIDHVLTRSVDVVDTRTVSLPGSDHRGLLARLRR